MTALGAAVADLARRLEAAQIPYMVGGGLANIHWGRNRVTEDVDVTVRIPDEQIGRFLAVLAPAFVPRTQDPVGFAGELSMVPLVSVQGTRVDLILGRLDLELEAIQRAVPVRIEGVPVWFISAEDLLIQKLISDRPRDRDDAEEIARRQAGRLDRDYLRPRIALLARAMELPDLVNDLERMLVTEP